MITLDTDNNIVENPDLESGYTSYETIGVRYRWVVEVEKQSHYEVIKEYPNGGKDLEEVVDVEEVGHWSAFDQNGDELTHWDGSVPDDWPKEEEHDDSWTFIRYKTYTDEQLAQIERDKVSGQIAELKSNLAQTDYVVIKMSEANATGVQLLDEEATRYADIIAQRKEWRSQINELEASLEGGEKVGGINKNRSDAS